MTRLAALEAVGDRTRQDVEQEGIEFGLRTKSLSVDEDDEAERERGRNDEVDRPDQEPSERWFQGRISDERVDGDGQEADQDDDPSAGAAAGAPRKSTAPSGTRMIQMRLATPDANPPDMGSR